MTDASTRGLLGMPHGPAGTDKAAAEQKLLDTAMREFPHLFAMDRIWLMDRNADVGITVHWALHLAGVAQVSAAPRATG